jgi:lysophospholipase L1-like esterase
MRHVARLLAVSLALLLVAPAWALPAEAREPTTATGCRGDHWVGSWAAAPSNAGHVEGVPFARPLADQTVRMAVHPTLSGHRVRVRLTNRYGVAPARISHATVAVRDTGAAAVPGTMRELTFDGAEAVTLPPGADLRSDPVDLAVEAGHDLLVSLHVPDVVDRPTEHFVTVTTNYLAPSAAGDFAADESGTAFATTTRHAYSVGWYFLAGVDVRAPRSAGAVVAFGDSITDGFQVTGPGMVEDPAVMDRNARYPDFLAERLRRRVGDRDQQLAVLNSGISGNRVLADADAPWPYGDAALHRLRDDLLRMPGVTDLVLLEGINDLGSSGALRARDLVDGLRRLVRRAQAAGLRVHLGTLTPTGGAARGHGSVATARRRAVVNRWIRTSGVADSVVDFDKAVRDPADPARLRPAYDSGDHLHPSSAGYRAMAAAVRLRSLAGSGC